MSPLLALVAAASVAVAGLAARALDRRAALAATAVGWAILHAGGLPAGAALLAFFASGSAIGRLIAPRGPELDAKGERRDAVQVLANGGAAALGALLAPAAAAPWVAAASLAAACADTWATATGRLSGRWPRHLLTGRVVPPGTSGGITVAGTAGALAGGALVAAAAALPARDAALFGTAAVLGFAGMLLDSLLGAAAQGRYHCPRCDAASEWPVHRCGTTTTRTGGLRWLTNDGVNALATAAAALGGWVAWRLLH